MRQHLREYGRPKVTTMQPDYLPASTMSAGQLLDPSYWLVSGLKWSNGQSLAEAALAVAPDTISRDAVSADVHQILGYADDYADKHSLRLVFLSDLMRMFTTAGASLVSPCVDWLAALRELRDGPHPAMRLTLTERASLLISDPGASRPVDYERELMRQVLTSKLTEDWPAYVRDLISSGQITPR